MKVLLHGACSYPFLYRELIPRAQRTHPEIEWRATLLSWRHREVMKGVLPEEHLFYVQPAVNAAFDRGMEAKGLDGFPGSIYECIAADKGSPGQMRTKGKDYQLRNAAAYHEVYRDYLRREAPSAVFFPIIEAHEAMILHAAARELGIPTVVYTHARNLGVSFFSSSPNEDLPPYALEGEVPAEVATRAAAWVADFDSRPASANALPEEPRPEEVFPLPAPVPLLGPRFWRPLRAGLNHLKDMSLEPHAGRISPLWYQPRIRFHKLLYALREAKGDRQRRYFDLSPSDPLPREFIYFPLQMTPESSINALAPYFVEQERAVDLLLYNMPSRMRLVVKEHPAMKGVRPSAFYEGLRKKPGVLLADYGVSSTELIRRAALTVSVTGTAVLEALFMGRPSLLLGRTFFSPWVESLDSFPGFRRTLEKAMSLDAEALRRRAVDCAARVLHCGGNFIFRDPYEAGTSARYTMNAGNLDKFMGALAGHLARLGIR